MIQMTMSEEDEFDVLRLSSYLGHSVENPFLAPRHTRIDQDKPVRRLDQVCVRPSGGDPVDSVRNLVQVLARPGIGH